MLIIKQVAGISLIIKIPILITQFLLHYMNHIFSSDNVKHFCLVDIKDMIPKSDDFVTLSLFYPETKNRENIENVD